MSNKILKITFHNNDFSGPLERACNDTLRSPVDDYEHYVADILADPEVFRSALMIRTFGHVVVEDTILKPEPAKRHIETRCRGLADYLLQNLQVELIGTMQHEPEWSNGEVVYVDLDAKTVETR